MCNATQASIETLGFGDHTCLIYETLEEYRQVASQYVEIGLNRGELVICVIDEYSRDQLINDLAQRHLPVQSFLDKGQLIISSIKNTYRGAKQFDPEATLAYWKSVISSCTSYTGLRVMGEATFALDGQYETLEKLIEYEIRVNIDLIPAYQRHQYLCIYNKHLYPAGVSKSIVRSHPNYIKGTDLHRQNPYYLDQHQYFQLHATEVELYRTLGLMDHSVKVNLEKQLRSDEERFHYVIESLSECIWDYDCFTEALYLNESLLHLLDRPLNAFPEKLSTFLHWMHPADAATFQQELHRHRQGISCDIKLEFLIQKSSGDWIWLDAIGKGISKTENGQIVRIVGTFRDITTRKLAEEELRKSHAELEGKVEIRTQELSAANQELTALNEEMLAVNEALLESVQHLESEMEVRRRVEAEIAQTNQDLNFTLTQLQKAQTHLIESEKMAALGGLVAGVAHEINTPLGNSVTAASYLHTELNYIGDLYQSNEVTATDWDRFFTDSHEGLSILEINLARAAELVRSFKNVAAAQTWEGYQVFDVRLYLEEVFLTLRAQLKKTKLQVHINCPDDLQWQSYPGALAQIITNLVMNSLIHAYPAEKQGNLTITVQPEDADIVLKYADDGKGMTEPVKKKIFEPFFTTNRSGGGIGLGLAIVYNLATQKLQGSIECDSSPAQGTQFILRLPRSIPETV